MLSRDNIGVHKHDDLMAYIMNVKRFFTDFFRHSKINLLDTRNVKKPNAHHCCRGISGSWKVTESSVKSFSTSPARPPSTFTRARDTNLLFLLFLVLQVIQTVFYRPCRCLVKTDSTMCVVNNPALKFPASIPSLPSTISLIPFRRVWVP